MTVSNLGVCFGPTLLRPEEETVASIMDLKFYNVVVEILITHYEKIFNTEPEKTTTTSSATPQASGGYNTNNTSSGHISPSSEHQLNNLHYSGGGGVDVQDVQYAWRPNVRHYMQQPQQPYTCVSFCLFLHCLDCILCFYKTLKLSFVQRFQKNFVRIK